MTFNEVSAQVATFTTQKYPLLGNTHIAADLNADGKPLYSLHSRVDGVNHGIVAAVEVGRDLVLIAKGPGRVLKLSLAGLAEEFCA